MKLFFPFSHITRYQLKVLSAFFSNLGYFPLKPDVSSDPMFARLTENNILTPLFSSAETLKTIEHQVQSYVDWANVHKGNENNLKSLIQDHPYFSEVTELARVQAQIKARIKSGPNRILEPEPGEKPLQDPLLLLKFAQLLDAQKEEIDEKFQRVAQSKSLLFSQLKGETLETGLEKMVPGAPDPEMDDPGRVMTEERVVSWARYAVKKGLFKEAGISPLLVTTSPAVLDFLMSKTREKINALDIDSIKVHENVCPHKQAWQQAFSHFLEEAIIGRSVSGTCLPWTEDSCALSGQLKLCIFPGGDINAFLNIPGKQLVVCLVQLKS